MTAESAKDKPKPKLREMLPEVWALMRPRRGLLLLGFGLMVVNRLAGLVLPASTKFLIDDVLGKRHTALLVPLVSAVILATLVQGASSYSLTQILSKAAQRLIADLRRQVQAHVGRLPVAYYDSNKTGVLVSRVMSDVEGVRNLLGTGMVEFAGALLTSVLALAILMRLSASMTLVAMAFLVVLGVALKQAMGKIRPMFRARPKIQGEVTGRLTESLGGIRVVKGYHAEAREASVFSAGVQRLLDNVLQTLTAMSVMNFSSSVLLGLISATLMYIGARQILGGTMTLGTLVTYTAFLAMLISPMFQIVGIGTQITEALAGLERTHEVLGERPEDQDPRRTRALDAVRGLVEFDGVSFAYEIGKPVLESVSLRAEPGTVTALVGPSGAGKSTIIGLIAAFYVATAGSVRVDGMDLATVRLDSYRRQLGVVLQETFLFDGTIRENVAFSRPDASEESILAACRIARVDEFAESFPLRYETIVGERGVKLSGGQRQRVSIARAILADPRILLLDEATSSLDSESEALIQEGLNYLMRGRTTFVIAHRLSTIRSADQILVVEAGRILERGRHEALLAARARYWDLYSKQHGLEANIFLAPGEAREEAEPAPAAASDDGANGGGALAEGVRLLRRQNE